MTDAELVGQARQGDPAAFGELVDRHHAAVYRAAMTALGSHADAEDAAQDAFLIAYRRLDSFRGEASFKTWLLTITWHQAINRRRSLTRIWRRMGRRQPDERDETLESIADAAPTPEAVAAQIELRRAVAAAIRRLSPVLRDTLLLAQSGECSYDDMGAMLNAPVGTIKWRVSEARRRVRQTLREHGFLAES